MIYAQAVIFTVISYIVGLFADANIDFGIDLSLRIFLPVVVMGVFIIHCICKKKDN